jgi:hypothetical protein
LLYHPDRKDPRATRRFVLQSRLDALLRILEADETRFYYAEIAKLTPEIAPVEADGHRSTR